MTNNSSKRNTNITVLIFSIYHIAGVYLSIYLNSQYNFFLLPFMQIIFILTPIWLLSGSDWESRKEFIGFKKIDFNINKAFILIAIAIFFQVAYGTFSALIDKLFEGTFISNFIEVRNIRVKMISDFLENANFIQLIFAIFSIAVIPALVEEITFRGFLQNSYLIESKEVKAILVPSVLFALLHLNPIDFIPIFIMAFILGKIAIKEKNIFYSIFLHFTINSIVVFGFLLNINDSNFEKNSFNLTYTIITFVLSSIVVFMLTKRILKTN